MRHVSNINNIYINHNEAIALVQALKDEGFDVTYQDCHEYAMNVISKVAGADGGQQRLVRSIIAEILDVEEAER